MLEEFQVVRVEWHDDEEDAHFVAAYEMEEEGAERSSQRLMPLLWGVGIGKTKRFGMHPLMVVVLPCIQNGPEFIFTQDVQRIRAK